MPVVCARMPSPVRILTAVPICDGHDSAINTINLEFIRHGIEVVYLGLSSLCGRHRARRHPGGCRAPSAFPVTTAGHIEFFAEVVSNLRARARSDIAVFGGGGGTITYDDAAADETQRRRSDFLRRHFADGNGRLRAQALRKAAQKRRGRKTPDMELARKLTEIEETAKQEKIESRERRTQEKIENRTYATRHRFYRARRGGQDNIDRRIGPAFSRIRIRKRGSRFCRTIRA